MQFKYLVTIIVVMAIIIGGYFLFRGGYQTPSLTPTQEPTITLQETETPTETSAPTQAPISGVREISVVGTEFSFNPASISVKTGEKVKIIFENNGRAPHNLVIKDLDVGTKVISGGQAETIEFIAPTSGTYTFFCSVPGHRASGMEGNLKVE